MYRTPLASILALLTLTVAAVSGACSSSNGSDPAKAPDGPDAAIGAAGDAATTPDAPIGVEDAGAADASPASRSLTLTLDPTLDGDDDDVKTTSLVTADLLDTKGGLVAHAAVAADAAVFDLANVAKGDYFLKVNGDADDLVPTRIDDPAVAVSQRVGQKLRASYIGPVSAPTYRINTWPAGQKESPVVGFSDDKAVDGAQPYLVFAFGSSQLELRVLGTARSLSTFPLGRCPGHADVPADGWLLNTAGEDHHGDVFNADGGAAGCSGCHMNYWMKKPSYSDISPSRGWCFKCHDGTDGARSGFVDATK